MIWLSIQWDVFSAYGQMKYSNGITNNHALNIWTCQPEENKSKKSNLTVTGILSHHWWIRIDEMDHVLDRIHEHI